jgi:two-component system, cell cycle sensor histidine kinase and response regulator CckA
MTPSARDPFDRAALTLLKPLLTTLVVVATGFAIFDVIAEPERIIVPILNVVVVVASAVAWWLVQRNRLFASWAQGEEVRRSLEEARDLVRREQADRVRAESLCVELRDQLAQSQKMETLGFLAGGLAHDMNNVLACLVTLAGSLCEDLPPESSQHEDAELIMNQSIAAAALTRNLLSFARQASSREEIQVGKVVEDVTQLLARALPRGTAIRTRLDHGDARVEGDASQLCHALVNICINASDAMGQGGTIELTSGPATIDDATGARLKTKPGPYVAIRVTDHGSGMDAETVRKAVEPFFTTKPIGKGTGLGLSMVSRTMQSHGGAFDLESELGRGTRVSLFLPVSTRCTNS